MTSASRPILSRFLPTLPSTILPASHNNPDPESGPNRNSGLISKMPSSSSGKPARPSDEAFSQQQQGIPFLELSHTPSRTPSPIAGPYTIRTRSATQSEDEDDAVVGGVPLSLRPLVAEASAAVGGWRRRGFGGWWGKEEGMSLGQWLFGTWCGWQVYAMGLVAWEFGMGLLLVLVNRVVFWAGVYKFPYPLTATYIQLLFTHLFLIAFSSLTRLFSNPLQRLGLSCLVAPSHRTGSSSSSHAPRPLGTLSFNPLRILSHAFRFTDGIAGGGLFEINKHTALTVLPVASVFVGKVLLSNISFAYAPIPLYTLSRIAILPVALLLTATLTLTSHSISTQSSSLTATLHLLIASINPRASGPRRAAVSWESIVAGVFSTLFVALFPILLDRTQRVLTAGQVAPGDVFRAFTTADNTLDPDDGSNMGESINSDTSPQNTTLSPPSPPPRPTPLGTHQSTHATYTLLQTLLLLSHLVLTPLVLLSGEPQHIFRNIYFLDVPAFWLLMASGGLASAAVLAATLPLVRATSPLTAVVVATPRAALQLVLWSGAGGVARGLPAHAWVGVALCWAACAWYALVRREEGRRGVRKRLGWGKGWGVAIAGGEGW